MGRLADALKAKFSSPQEAIRALGLDPELLDEGDDKMNSQFSRDAYNKAYRAAMDAARSMVALDSKRARDEDLYSGYNKPADLGGWDRRNARDRRYGRDELSESGRRILDLIRELPEDERQEVFEALMGETELGSPDALRRRARDMPPDFEGRPEGGAADPAVMRQQRDWDRKAEDRRRRGLGADSMYGLGPRPTSALESKSFHAMFPQAKRIGYLG